jgi:flagellar biosynthesis/type III secretory pathway chaperone
LSRKWVNNVDTFLSELIDVLNQEIALHKELLSFLQKDGELLIDLSAEKIFENNKKKETCTLKIKMLEESRSSLVDKLSLQYSIPSPELTLSRIVSLAEEPYHSALDAARSILASLVKSMKEVNQSNCLIVKDSLNYFKQSLDFLSGASAVSPTYLDSGKMKDPSGFGRFLSREV